MSSYQHKSGAQKRKEREEKEKKSHKGQLPLSQFFTTKVPTQQFSAEGSPKPTEKSSFNALAGPSVEVPVSLMTTPNEDLELTLPLEFISEESLKEGMSESPAGSLMEFVHDVEKFCDIGDPNFTITDLKYPHSKPPDQFPMDRAGHSITKSIFKKKLINGEYIVRDWLVWSLIKEAFFCLPCKVFSDVPEGHRSLLAASGYSGSTQKWKKLHDRVPEHENGINHRQAYIQWKAEVKKLNHESSLSDMFLKQIKSEIETWKELLRRFFDVTLFLGERGLSFRGDSNRIGDPSNGNFLGILELIAHYDPVLSHHVKKVREAQEKGKKTLTYLSPDIQNEFISICAGEVTNTILEERKKAKYYSVIVDATPDSSHLEQTTILLRYCHSADHYEVKERLLSFVDCSMKTGEAIARLIMTNLEERKIPFADCRGQGYDNGSNMKGKYKGVQAIFLAANNLAVYSACAGHSLNLCGEKAAECCPEAITFFGSIQKMYNIFSSSPQRWEIMKKHIRHSLHSMSQTRWSARVDSVKPIANHLPGLVLALEELLLLNLTAESRSEINGLIKYTSSLNFLLIIVSVWTKLLQAIDIVNKVIQAKVGSIDVAVNNIKGLMENLQDIRNTKWEAILNEVTLVANNIKWPTALEDEKKRGRKRKKSWSERETHEPELEEKDSFQCFKINVFYVVLDEIISDLLVRFESLSKINDLFSVLWMGHSLTESEIEKQASNLAACYPTDIEIDLIEELKSMKVIYASNLGESTLSPLELLNALKSNHIQELFPNIVTALRIFLTIPSTVASAERSFSVLKRIKSVQRSTMCQSRLNSLGVLCVEADLARKINLESVIAEFAKKKAWKISLA